MAHSSGSVADDRLTATGRALLCALVLFHEDLAAAFGIPEDEAAELLESGAFGPRFKFQGRFAILRATLIRHLQDQECSGPEQHVVSSDPKGEREPTR